MANMLICFVMEIHLYFMGFRQIHDFALILSFDVYRPNCKAAKIKEITTTIYYYYYNILSAQLYRNLNDKDILYVSKNIHS